MIKYVDQELKKQIDYYRQVNKQYDRIIYFILTLIGIFAAILILMIRG